MPSSRKKQRTTSFSAAEAATPLGASSTSTLPTDDEMRLTASLFGTAPPRAPPKQVTIDADQDDDDEEETGLEGYDDSQLFEIDGGARDEDDEEEEEEEEEDDDDDEGSSSDASSSSSSSSSSASSSALSTTSPQNATTSAPSRKPPSAAWHDPSTSSLIVPLVGPQARAPDGSFAGTKRLRKLRVTADERTITGVEYERRLREQYEKMHPRPAWASNRRALPVAASSKNASASDAAAPTLAELLSRDTGLVASASTRRHRPLPPGQLAIERQRDVLQHPASTTRFDDEEEDVADPSVDLASAIECLSFHPSSASSTARTRLLMTASRDRRIRLYSIDGRENPLLQTVHVPSLPLRRAAWHPGGQSILLAGPRPYLYSYDVQTAKALRSTPWRGLSEDEAERDLSMAEFQPEAGRGLLAIGGRRGKVHMLDWGRSANVASSSGGGGGGGSHLLTTLTHNAPLAGLAWDGEQQLVSLGQDGSFQLWDTRAMRCSVSTRDTGLHAPNHLAASPDGSRFAVGTQSGVVAVYSRDSLTSSNSQLLEPVKSLSNLITSTSTLRFDGSSQILALASRSKKDALRLAHAKDCSVFSNWPTSGTPLGRVSDVAFATPSGGSSGGGGLVAVGNTRGRTLLFNLGHFS